MVLIPWPHAAFIACTTKWKLCETGQRGTKLEVGTLSNEVFMATTVANQHKQETLKSRLWLKLCVAKDTLG